MVMDSFTGKLAVVTGGGSGMGRELTRQLAAQGCSVAACDLHPETMAETAAMARAEAPAGVHVDLVFSNAGAGGGESFVESRREVWERIFAIDWWGVYHCARVFLPLLIASGDGILVNTSSVNGFWASLGPGVPQSAYSAAKFAVRGFTEALIEDLRTNAPGVRAVLVLPGHVGTNIITNSLRARGLPEPAQLTDAQAEELVSPGARDALIKAGALPPRGGRRRPAPVPGPGQRRLPGQGSSQRGPGRDHHRDGIRAGTWRILIGEDAKVIDAAVRARPEAAYDYAELFVGLTGTGEPAS